MNTTLKNILICGLGGVGCVCATALNDTAGLCLKILVDKDRIKKYELEPTTYNGKKYIFDYILPNNSNFKADLIIIATKDDGLNTAIKNIKNFVKTDTIIISLLNGIHSEDEIAKVYGWKNLLYSFYLGNSCIRENRTISMSGSYNITLGTNIKENENALEKVESLFKLAKINYKIESNILDEYWKKFLINVGINQTCAYTGLELKEIRKNNEHINTLKTLMNEAMQIAERMGIKNHLKIYKNAEKFLLEELDNAHPSMLQDIENKRKTELEIFAGKVIELGKHYGIETPENEKIYNFIKQAESNYLQENSNVKNL